MFLQRFLECAFYPFCFLTHDDGKMISANIRYGCVHRMRVIGARRNHVPKITVARLVIHGVFMQLPALCAHVRAKNVHETNDSLVLNST